MKKRILLGLLSSTLLLTACNNATDTSKETPATDEATEDVAEDVTDNKAGEDMTESPVETDTADVTIKTLYSAPHGDRAFASTFVVLDGDTIVDVLMDEYQFMEDNDVTGVPNSDAAFGTGAAEGVTLISKLENDETYSERMKEAGSTVSYSDNLEAIEKFTRGKTVRELEETITKLEGLGEEDDISDVVSGATLVDTAGYLQSIVDTATKGMEFVGAQDVDLADAELSYSLEAPHGEQSFAVVSVLHDKDKVLAASLDEFQFLDPADFKGVPNSDATFGENYQEDVVLASKMQNDEAYSALMTDIADAKHSYSDNIQAIIKSTVGATTGEIEDKIKELNGLGENDDISDVVSGATFVDTSGYLQAIVDTVNK